MANHRLDPKEYKKRFDDMHMDRYELVSEYTINTNPVTIRCKKCDNTFTRARAGNVISGSYPLTCPYCDPKKVTNITIQGVDDLWTTDPDIAKLLIDKTDGYKHGRGSSKTLKFQCPICGNVVSKQIDVVVKAGFTCNYCGDGYSYPNKFMMGVLDKSGIDFIPEFRIKDNPFRYDFYFKHNDIDYLIEMDGAFVHGCNDTKSLTKQQQIDIDNKKDILAKSNGYKIVRIDCKYNNCHPDKRFEYVYSHIKSSEISFVLNGLSEDDIKIINHHCNHYSKLLDFVDIWNNEERSYDYVMNKLHITKHTVLDYAKRSIDLGFINVDYNTFCKTMSRNGWNRLSKQKSTPVMCNETGEVFASMKDAQVIGGYYNISAQIAGKVKRAGSLPDGTGLTWRKISYDEYLKLVS